MEHQKKIFIIDDDEMRQFFRALRFGFFMTDTSKTAIISLRDELLCELEEIRKTILTDVALS